MQDTWVIVADAGRARIFKTKRHKDSLVEIKTLLNPQGRLSDAELVSDRQGRSFDSMGQGRHAMEPKTTVKKQQLIEFTRTLAAELERARADGEFKHLVLVAAPACLGELRKHLGSETAKQVSLELAKDFSQLDAGAIRQRLPETFPAAI